MESKGSWQRELMDKVVAGRPVDYDLQTPCLDERVELVLEKVLAEAERTVLRERYCNGKSFTAIGQELGLSGARCSQMEHYARQKIWWSPLTEIILNSGQPDAISFLKTLDEQERRRQSLFCLNDVFTSRQMDDLKSLELKTVGDLADVVEKMEKGDALGSRRSINLKEMVGVLKQIGFKETRKNTEPNNEIIRKNVAQLGLPKRTVRELTRLGINTPEELLKRYKTIEDMSRTTGLGETILKSVENRLWIEGIEIPEHTQPAGGISQPKTPEQRISEILFRGLLNALPSEANCTGELCYRKDSRIFSKKKAAILTLAKIAEDIGGKVSMGRYASPPEECVWYLELDF